MRRDDAWTLQGPSWHRGSNGVAPQVRDESSDDSPVDLPAIQGTALGQKDLEQGFLGLPLVEYADAVFPLPH